MRTDIEFNEVVLITMAGRSLYSSWGGGKRVLWELGKTGEYWGENRGFFSCLFFARILNKNWYLAVRLADCDWEGLMDLQENIEESKRKEMSDEVSDSNPYSRLMALKKMHVVQVFLYKTDYAVGILVIVLLRIMRRFESTQWWL